MVEELNDPVLLMGFLRTLAVAAFHKPDPIVMQQCHAQILDLARKVGDRLVEGRILGALGTDAWDSGDYESCLTLYQQAEAILAEINQRFGLAALNANIGLAYLYLGDYSVAQARFAHALSIVTEIRNPTAEVMVLSYTGLLYGSMGDHATGA